MNIKFGKNMNNTNKVKKIYNRGNIITARPQTAKYPYKILSVKEFPKPNQDNLKNTKNDKNSHIFECYIKNYNKNPIKKSFSFVHDSQKGVYIKKEIENKSSFKRFFLANHKKYLTSINNDINRTSLIKNRKLLIKRGINSNKKKDSSYSKNRYIEKYIDKEMLNYNNKSLNINNIQIKNFLSETINNNNLQNFNYNNTANNIIINYKKFKNSTRNPIIPRHYNNINQNKTNLSYNKNRVNQLKPLIINFKENFDLIHGEKVNNNNHNIFLKYHNKCANEIKLNTQKSSRVQKTIPKKKINKRKTIRKEENKNYTINSINKNNFTKNNNWKNRGNFGINKYKKKLRLSKNTKIKNKKKKVIHNKDIENEFFRYINNFKKGKFHYINRTKDSFHGLENRKNYDIYDYLISPKNSEGITDISNKNYYIEYKYNNH